MVRRLPRCGAPDHTHSPLCRHAGASRLPFASAVHMHPCRRNRKYIVFGPTLDSDADSERLRGRLGSVDAGA